MVVAASNGSPSRIRWLTALASSVPNSSRTFLWTRSLSLAVQLWPAHRKQPTIVAATAGPRSASSITTSGPLPPISSSCAFPAARRATWRPVRVEPMKATPAVAGFPAISSPTTGPGPVTKLNTPAGRSASATHSASRAEQTAVEGAGVHTTVLPHASAGAISSAGMV